MNNSNILISVDTGSDVWMSENNGSTWIKINDDYNGAEGNGATAMAVDSNNILYVLDATSVWKSNNSGINWTKQTSDFDVNDGHNGFSIITDSNNYLYLIDGNEDVYQSVNSGINWTKLAINFNAGNGNVRAFSTILINTNLSFFVRNCSLSDCSDGNFVNANLNNINLTGRYFQYLVNFSSQDTSMTPKLHNSTLSYTILDNTPPLISIISPQARNYTSQTIEFNVSLNEEGNSCLYSLDNWQTNYTMTKLNNTYFYHSNLISDGFYIARFSCLDNFGNANNTVTRNFGLDSTYPVITIDSPQNGGSYGYNSSINLNFSAFDSNGISKCWYNIDNGINISLPGCANTSFNVSGNGNYVVKVYANDSFGLVSNDSSGFSVQIGAPGIILDSPTDIYLNNSYVEFKYTPSDVILSSCELWGDFTGEFKLNHTNNIPLY